MPRMQDFSRFRSDLILSKITSCKLLILLTYYNYEFWLSLCKIVQSSVILLLPLITDITDITDISECCDIPQKRNKWEMGLSIIIFSGAQSSQLSCLINLVRTLLDILNTNPKYMITTKIVWFIIAEPSVQPSVVQLYSGREQAQ
jgi:hypothetical protein